MNHYINANRFRFRWYIRILSLVLLYYIVISKCIVSAQTPNTDIKWMQFIENEPLQNNSAIYQSNTRLLHFEKLVTFHDLSEMGFTVYRRMGNNVVIGKFENESKSSFHLNYQSYATNGLWKLSENLLNTYSSSGKLNGSYWIKVSNINEITNYINQHDAINILNKRGNYFLLNIENLDINSLLINNEILYLGEESSEVKSEANVLDLNLHPNRINTVHHNYPQLKGRNQTLSLKEPFYNINDIDLAGRFVPSGLESNFIDSHATQMATITVGAGNLFLTGRGVAPEALHSSSSNAQVIPDTQEDYQRLNIQIQNHSYGTEIEPFYGAMAALFDESSFQNPNLLHVFSSGNSGQNAPEEGTYAGIEGFSNLTGNFKQAKNILTVGSIDTTHTPIARASKGPAYDGRVKPELVTYSMAGTSNSAALVSGTALLLQERFKLMNDAPIPAALLKGLLINSADDVFNKGVDFTTGFGQLNALRAVENLNNQFYFSGQLEQGDAQNLILEVPENAVNLKITLIWNDPPANANDEIALVHDLDLSVITPSNSTYLPMVLNTNPASLNDLAIQGVDRINNVEQVIIENPESGDYQIKINSFNIVDGVQSFYVLYQWDLANQFRWTSPTGSDNIPYNGNTTSHLRWESSFDIAEGNLSYKILVGEEASDWITIDNEINLENEQFRWDAPNIYNLAILKMEVEGIEFLSDTFSIGAPVRLGVGFNCSDSISLVWPAVPNAEFYEIQTINNNKMETISTTLNTSLVLNKGDLSSAYFKIIPYIDNQPIIESFAIDYELQGAGCFLNAFFVEAVQDSGVFLTLRLGALNGTKELKFQKLNTENSWETFTIKQTDQFTYKILDSNARDGNNSYRVQIFFENGVSIISEVASTYYVNSQDFIVYPNPAKSMETLYVYSRLFEGTYQFKLFNLAGGLVYTTELSDVRSFIELPTLQDGVYLYIIHQNNAIKSRSKLVIGN